MKIPLVDLRAQHDPLRPALFAAIGEVIDRNAFAGGPFVERFEHEFATFCGTRHAVGVGNGTDALWLALAGLGVGPGDEVITVAHTFMATAEAISLCGATPVFVDIDERTYTMDPALIEAAITRRTKAIVPVHLYGQMADMDPIMEIAARHNLFVVEDACQAHGAEYRGRRAGSIGHAGCFSFYPGKNLGALGEAGAVATNDDALSEVMRVFRDHGQTTKYRHERVGWNARMDGIQAAALSIKLRHLDGANERRRENADLYGRFLGDLDLVQLPEVDDRGEAVYHLYVVRVPQRDTVIAALGRRGIGCGIHYPVPVHLQDAYAFLGLEPGSLPVTERCAQEILSLPMFPELDADSINLVAAELRMAVGQALPALMP